jgi:spore germination protein GerM
LTPAERAAGYSTEFPNRDFKLESVDLVDGIATLRFTEVSGFTDGGSCRVGLLWAQIEKTATQFPDVRQVLFTPETLFQP